MSLGEGGGEKERQVRRALRATLRLPELTLRTMRSHRAVSKKAVAGSHFHFSKTILADLWGVKERAL